MLTGLILAMLSGYMVEALTAQRPANRLIGIGMWLALIMAFNVWFMIWPNQKKALGLVEADDATKAKAARTAMLDQPDQYAAVDPDAAMTNFLNGDAMPRCPHFSFVRAPR